MRQKKLRVLELFAGIGGWSLGLERAGLKIVGQVEISEAKQAVLKARYPKVKKFTDICALSAKHLRSRCGSIDVIVASPPCQDVSAAGKQEGLTAERSGLWREVWRLVRELRPDYVLIENSPNYRTKGVDGILTALEAINYTAESFVVAAEHVGAPHERKRVYIVAYSNSVRIRFESGRRGGGRQKDLCVAVADTESTGQARSWRGSRVEEKSARPFDGGREVFPMPPGYEQYGWEPPRLILRQLNPDWGEALMGFPIGWTDGCGLSRREQVHAIGDAVVPQVTELFGRWIVEVSGNREQEKVETHTHR